MNFETILYLNRGNFQLSSSHMLTPPSPLLLLNKCTPPIRASAICPLEPYIRLFSAFGLQKHSGVGLAGPLELFTELSLLRSSGPMSGCQDRGLSPEYHFQLTDSDIPRYRVETRVSIICRAVEDALIEYYARQPRILELPRSSCQLVLHKLPLSPHFRIFILEWESTIRTRRDQGNPACIRLRLEIIPFNSRASKSVKLDICIHR